MRSVAFYFSRSLAKEDGSQQYVYCNAKPIGTIRTEIFEDCDELKALDKAESLEGEIFLNTVELESQ
jgi:hypothetical protein